VVIRLTISITKCSISCTEASLFSDYVFGILKFIQNICSFFPIERISGNMEIACYFVHLSRALESREGGPRLRRSYPRSVFSGEVLPLFRRLESCRENGGNDCVIA
jgi:hypothetical protein